jgi:hypothetical protein
MYAPDGTLGDVPYENMTAALQAGGKMGTNMLAPDGTKGVVPADRVQDAIKAGGKVQPFDISAPAQPKEGFWPAVGSDLKALGGGLLNLTNDPTKIAANAIQSGVQTATDMQARSQEGRSPAYNALATGAEATGIMNPRPMEEAANAGDVEGVKGHIVVPAAQAVSPLVGEGIARVGGKIADAIPSRADAGASLADVKATAGNVPIDITKPGNTALELYEQSQRGAQLPMAARKLVNRMTDPNAPPLTYAEAKDFQSNISSLSANEKMNLKPNTARLLGQLNADLKDSLAQAADTVGKGEQFTDAMDEYHKAMQVKGMADTGKAVITRAALGYVGLSFLKSFLGIK